MFDNQQRFFPKHAKRWLRIIKKNSLVMGEQPAETSARGEEEYLELYWY